MINRQDRSDDLREVLRAADVMAATICTEVSPDENGRLERCEAEVVGVQQPDAVSNWVVTFRCRHGEHLREWDADDIRRIHEVR